MKFKLFFISAVLIGIFTTQAYAARAVTISISVDGKVVASNVVNGVNGDDPFYYAGLYYKADDKATLSADKDSVTLKGKITIAWGWSSRGNTIKLDQLTLTRVKKGPAKGNNSNGYYAIRKGDTMWVISKKEIERIRKQIKK